MAGESCSSLYIHCCIHHTSYSVICLCMLMAPILPRTLPASLHITKHIDCYNCYSYCCMCYCIVLSILLPVLLHPWLPLMLHAYFLHPLPHAL